MDTIKHVGGRYITDVLIGVCLVDSKAQARRLILQGAVKVNEEMIVDIGHIVNYPIKTLSVGEKTMTFIMGEHHKYGDVYNQDK